VSKGRFLMVDGNEATTLVAHAFDDRQTTQYANKVTIERL